MYMQYNILIWIPFLWLYMMQSFTGCVFIREHRNFMIFWFSFVTFNKNRPINVFLKFFLFPFLSLTKESLLYVLCFFHLTSGNHSMSVHSNLLFCSSWCSIVLMYHTLFNQSPKSECLGSFLYFIVTNNVAVNNLYVWWRCIFRAYASKWDWCTEMWRNP